MKKTLNASMQPYLHRQFREWASAAVRMRDAMKRHANDSETVRIRQDMARQDAAKARFYYQAMNVGAGVQRSLSR